MNYAIILCAGKGSRMNFSKPKYMMPLLDKPLINYILDSICKSCIAHTICVLKSEEEFKNLPSFVECCIQKEPLGTLDAVKTGLKLINDDGNVLIIPGDVPLISKEMIDKLFKFHEKNNNDISFISFINDNPCGYGRVIENNNLIIKEDKELTEEEKNIKEVYSGIMCAKIKELSKLLPKVKKSIITNEYYLTDIIKYSKKVKRIIVEDSFTLSGVNNLKELSKLESEYRFKIINDLISNNVYIENKYNTIIGPDVIFNPPVYIKSGSIILGKSSIGKNCIIGPHTSINNSKIGNSVFISYSVINDSKVLDEAIIGPFSNIRNNTIIGKNNRIGNFSEIKNSIIGDNTKIAHLSYVGDTTCGKNVNFGCGTITVNYDGKNKYRTNIKDNVFIGCNSNLIAPVNIEKGCYIAAGATLTKDLEENDFFISRPDYLIKNNYISKYNCGDK